MTELDGTVANMRPGDGWRRSSLCANGGCVEVKRLPDGGVAIRDSKDERSPVLEFDEEEWRAFLGGIRLGEFDD